MATTKVKRDSVSDDYATEFAQGGVKPDQELAQCRAELLALRVQYESTLAAMREQNSAIYNQENHIKSLEASEKKYVEAAAKLVDTTKERNEYIEKIGALRRCAHNSSKLIKVAIQTLESARELAD